MCVVLMLLTLLPASSAEANLDVFYSDVGNLSLSADAAGNNDGTAIVQVNKPVGATVKKAFMFAASTGALGVTPVDGDVALDGVAVHWLPEHTLPSSINSANVAADVTSQVKEKVDPATAGPVEFTVGETATFDMDGEILVVVFNDPSAKTRSIFLMYGAQATTGDNFGINLASPLLPSSTVTMSLGISYGYQPAGQYSEVSVNSTRLTTSAGGYDDGIGENGGLITVGGIGDDTDNPPDAFANDLDCLGIAPRCDDELYDLKPFVPTSSTSIDIDTFNPSNDDNILFAAFDLSSVTASVGESVLLSPSGTRTQVGFFHFFKAHVQDQAGDPIAGRSVKLEVVSGPSDGLTLTAATNSDGDASFNYLSQATGTDSLIASYLDDSNVKHSSNLATHTWAPRVAGTLGGEWPFDGSSLPLYYTYGGGHRYLGNVFQGAANWNGSGTKLQIDDWPGAPSAVHIPVGDVYTSDTWWGATLFAEDCVSCGYTRNSILLNQRTLDPASDAQRTKVATHEFGHAVGLDHPDGSTASSTPSVMWQGLLGGRVRKTPQALDISRVKGMYP